MAKSSMTTKIEATAVATAKCGIRIGQGVEDAAHKGHQPADHAAQIGMAAAGQAAVVGEGLGEAHADARAHRCRQTHQERGPAVLCVANAAANKGAKVDTEPSIKPTSPGWMTCNTKSCRAVSASSCCSSSG